MSKDAVSLEEANHKINHPEKPHKQLPEGRTRRWLSLLASSLTGESSLFLLW